MATINLHEFKAADQHLVRMCKLGREHPGLKPLAFEALMRAGVIVWVDAFYAGPTGGLGIQSSGQRLPFRQLRNPAGGVAEFAAAFFTDLAHFHEYVEESGLGQRQCYLPQDTPEVVRALAEQGLPVIIDPGSSHRLYLTRTQVRDWLSVWERAGHPQPADLPGGRQFVSWEAHPALLDRLGAFLAQFETVDRAWVCQLGDGLPNLHEGGTLLLSNRGAEFERIRQALPLISDGLRNARALHSISTLPRPFEEMPRQRQELLAPVYDRSMSLYRGRRKIAC